jgi:hypothetical protein
METPKPTQAEKKLQKLVDDAQKSAEKAQALKQQIDKTEADKAMRAADSSSDGPTNFMVFS